jgi:2,5-dihydroxypyridine 5,6-dioxygenase
MGGKPVQKAKLVSLFQAEFERCKVQKGEKTIVLSGERARPGYAEAAAEALQNIGASVFEMRPPAPRSTSGKGKPSVETVGLTPVSGNDIAIETLKLADFVVDLVMLLHSPEQVEILESGTRILMVIEPPEVLNALLRPRSFARSSRRKLKS